MAFFGGDDKAYPMQSRTDCMSLGTISGVKDNVRTTTKKFASIRATSDNLHTSDIIGKFY
jgi:hypothetical protein